MTSLVRFLLIQISPRLGILLLFLIKIVDRPIYTYIDTISTQCLLFFWEVSNKINVTLQQVIPLFQGKQCGDERKVFSEKLNLTFETYFSRDTLLITPEADII